MRGALDAVREERSEAALEHERLASDLRHLGETCQEDLGESLQVVVGRVRAAQAAAEEAEGTEAAADADALGEAVAEIKRKSLSHALNIKAVSRRAACEMGVHYEDLNLIVAHLGGGISVTAHRKGRMVDVVGGIDSGPFSPERAGSLPITELIDLCYSGIAKNDLKKQLAGKGGLISPARKSSLSVRTHSPSLRSGTMPIRPHDAFPHDAKFDNTSFLDY